MCSVSTRTKKKKHTIYKNIGIFLCNIRLQNRIKTGIFNNAIYTSKCSVPRYMLTIHFLDFPSQYFDYSMDIQL